MDKVILSSLSHPPIGSLRSLPSISLSHLRFNKTREVSSKETKLPSKPAPIPAFPFRISRPFGTRFIIITSNKMSCPVDHRGDRFVEGIWRILQVYIYTLRTWCHIAFWPSISAYLWLSCVILGAPAGYISSLHWCVYRRNNTYILNGWGDGWLGIWSTVCGRYCVVFTLNRSFYSTTSVHTVSVLILHPREVQIMWSQTETREKPKQPQLMKVRQVKC